MAGGSEAPWPGRWLFGLGEGQERRRRSYVLVDEDAANQQAPRQSLCGSGQMTLRG